MAAFDVSASGRLCVFGDTPHALGFHALQAVPLVAWLFSRSLAPEQEARPWVHAAGAAWLTACLGIAWQTAAGRPVTEPSLAMLATVVVLFGWLVCAARALRAWRASRPRAVLQPATRRANQR